MGDAPQVGVDEWDLAHYKRFVDAHVTSLRDWYHRRARRNRLAFRGAGVFVILLSAVLPLLAGFDFAHKDWTLGGIGVAIAVTVALRSFFQWDQLWALLRQADFDLTELLAEWDLAVAGAKPADIHELTEKLLQAANEVRARESKGYFSKLQFPESKRG
jgi:Protein of unknown function (DUF4231)